MKSASFVSRAAPRRSRLLAGAAGLLITLAGCGYGNDYGCDYGCPVGPPAPVNVPNSIAIADVNGDGIPDLVVATTLDQGALSNPGFANVIIGKSPAGTFDSGVQYSTTGSNPAGIVATDLTSSGHLDLVVANNSGSISIFTHGATAGSFLPAVNIATGGQPNQVVAGDLTGSGKSLDLALADNSPSGNAIVLVHDAANPGQFLAPILLPTNNFTPSVAIGSLGNGKVAVVAATYDANGNNGAVYVFIETSTSPVTFAAPVTFPAGAQPQAVRIADVNGDGLPDLVVANFGPGTDGTGMAGVSVLLQNAASPGSFLAPVSYATPDGAVDVVVGDLNGDGRPDLVVASLDPDFSGGVSVLLQNAAPAAAGTFGTATVYAGFGQPLSVAISPATGGALPFIAVADGTSASVMLPGATPGTFANPVQVGN